MKKINRIKKNGLENVVETLAQQKMESNLFTAPLQNMESADYNLRKSLYTFRWTQLSMRYATDGVFKTLVQQPILDALKNGIEITSEQLNQNDLDELNKQLDKKNILKIIKDVFVWNRLFGGSALIIEVAGQDTNDNLSFDNIPQGAEVNYYAVNRWELSNNNATTGNQLDGANRNQDLYYYGNFINPDRIMLLQGVEAPSYVKQILQGWGLSVCEPLIAPSNAYQKSMNLIYELIDESKIDVYSVEGLKETVAAGQNQMVIDQIQLTNILKNFQNAIVLDSTDKYEQKQLNITGVVDVIRELKLDVCSAVKIPAVILWGMSPSGFSSGEFDLKSYYGNIESEIRPEIKNVLLRVLQIECQALFGFIPDDLDFNFQQLLIQTETEVQQAKDREFVRLKNMYDSKLLTKREFFDALKASDIFAQKTIAGEVDEYTETPETTTKDFDRLDL